MKKLHCKCGWDGYHPRTTRTFKRDEYGYGVIAFIHQCPRCDHKFLLKELK